jgi:hypothetical protein
MSADIKMLTRGTDSGLVGSTDFVSREQKLLKGHIPRVIHHHVYKYTKRNTLHRYSVADCRDQ